MTPTVEMLCIKGDEGDFLLENTQKRASPSLLEVRFAREGRVSRSEEVHVRRRRETTNY